MKPKWDMTGSNFLTDNGHHMFPSRAFSHYFCPVPHWRPQFPGVVSVLLPQKVWGGCCLQPVTPAALQGCLSDTLDCCPLAAGAGRQKQITVSPSPEVRGQVGFPFHASSQGSRTGNCDQKFSELFWNALFLEYSGGVWEDFCSLLGISACPHKQSPRGEIFIFLATSLSGSY